MASFIETPKLEAHRGLHGARQKSHRHTLCVIGTIAFAGVVCYSALLTASSFVCLRTSSVGKIQSLKGKTLRAADDGVVEMQTAVIPEPPESIEEMTQQAADASMAAYRGGITRQTVQLRLDVAVSEAGGMIAGSAEKLNKTLPMVEDYTAKLWGGQMLKGVRSQGIDEEVAMLIYRQATDEMYDAGVFFLTGRTLVTSAKLRNYFNQMDDRLVVLVNSEDADDPFNVRFKARDWALGEDSDIGTQITKYFGEISYYYRVGAVNNWQLIQYRAYPHPWQIWVENLDYKLEKIGEFVEQPSFDELDQCTRDYETVNNIPNIKKMEKMIKDQSRSIKAWAEAPLKPDDA